MEPWSNFFFGELGAAAAMAGLLFVSVSVNQARILELGQMANRGIEALLMLFLVITVASLALVPGQPPRLLGIEIFSVAAVMQVVLVRLQIGYLRDLDPVHRRRATWMTRFNRLTVLLILAGGIVLFGRGDWMGLYLLPPGILLTFGAVGANAWVLLIEINR